MLITKKFMLSALAISTALWLIIAAPQTNQCVNASRRHYSRVYRSHRNHRRTSRRSHRTRQSRYGYIHGHKLYYLSKPTRHTYRRRRVRSYYHRHAATRNKRRTRRANHRIIRRRHRAARPSYHQEVINDLKAEGEVPMRTKSEIQAQEQAAREQTFKDINDDRVSLGEEPLTEDPTLDSLAQERAWQLDHVAYSHATANGDPYTDVDGGPYVGAENIDQTCDSTSEGYGVNGKQGADEANDSFFNNERPSYNEPQGGGHYMSITGQGSYQVGIGAYYNGQDGTGYNIVEDFG